MSTLVSSIITDAFRETNLIPLGMSPTTDQSAEAFRRLSSIVAAVLGNEAGETLVPFPLGQNAIESPSGYPWWSNTLPSNTFINPNTRLMLNLTGAGSVNLHPKPHDGARMGIVDVSGNLSSHPLTIYGNGRLIEGQTQMVYNTNSETREWFYREDQGNWVTVTPLDSAGTMPFPPEFDDMFIIMLAMRLNPRNGQVINPASVDALKSAMTKFSARYKQSNTEMPSEEALLRTTNTYRVLGRLSSSQYSDPISSFNSGYPY